MRYLFLVTGVLLLLHTGLYFFRLAHYLQAGLFTLSPYGKGLLAGRILLFLAGVFLLWLGLRRTKKERNDAK